MALGLIEYKIKIKWWARPLLLVAVALRVHELIGVKWAYDLERVK